VGFFLLQNKRFKAIRLWGESWWLRSKPAVRKHQVSTLPFSALIVVGIWHILSLP
jgi:hypothetical protein